MTVHLVSGFFPIADHPREAARYEELAEALRSLRGRKTIFYEDEPARLWLSEHATGRDVVPSTNPQKDTFLYHAVNHQKFQWLRDAGRISASGDVLVWIDYGIFHLPVLSPAHVEAMLQRLHVRGPLERILIPGCWNERGIYPLGSPSWRFCGGLIVCPALLAGRLFEEVQNAALRQIASTGLVEWEVNTLARVEERNVLPIQWYSADHNASMFAKLPL